MLPVIHLALKILMAVIYCGRQLARRLWWAATAYHENEGATLHAGVRKRNMQCDGMADWLFGVQGGMWNFGGLSGNLGEVCEELRKRMIDVCCLQEVRWIVQGCWG